MNIDRMMAVRANQRATTERTRAEMVAQANAQAERNIREPIPEWDDDEYDDEYVNDHGVHIPARASSRYLAEERGRIGIPFALILVYLCALTGITHGIVSSPLFNAVKARANVIQTAEYRMDVPHAACEHGPVADLYAYLRCRSGR